MYICIWIPCPYAQLLAHTLKTAEVEFAINFTHELFWMVAQKTDPKGVFVSLDWFDVLTQFVYVELVLPQYPFKLQIGVALAQKSFAAGFVPHGGCAFIVNEKTSSKIMEISLNMCCMFLINGLLLNFISKIKSANESNTKLKPSSSKNVTEFYENVIKFY